MYRSSVANWGYIWEVFVKAFVVLLVCVLLLSLTGCEIKPFWKGPTPTPIPPTPTIYESCNENNKCNITLWYPFQNAAQNSFFRSVAERYASLPSRQYITVTTIGKGNYREYESEVLTKFGTSVAPDIFLVRNDWMNYIYKDKLQPLPYKSRVLQIELEKIKAQDGAEGKGEDAKTKDSYTTVDFSQNFFPAFKDDFLQLDISTKKDGNTASTEPEYVLYGVPLYYQGLALFINKSIVSDYNLANPTAAVTLPDPEKPLTWNEFVELALKLTKTKDGWYKAINLSNEEIKVNLDPKDIILFGSALGDGTTIRYTADIFTLLLMQNGIPIVSSDRTKALFDSAEHIEDSARILSFYVSLSKLWNPDYGDSMNAFLEGKVAMVFGRSFEVRAALEDPDVDLHVVPVPQLRREPKEEWVTDSFYWSFVVNKDSKNLPIAWDFLRYLSSQDIMKSFATTVQHPTVRVDSINDLRKERNYHKLYGVFNQQLPFAKGFYKGNAESVDLIFKEAIKKAQQESNSTAVDRAAKQALIDAGQKYTAVLRDYRYR